MAYIRNVPSSLLLHLIPVFAWSAFIGLWPRASADRADNDGTRE